MSARKIFTFSLQSNEFLLLEYIVSFQMYSFDQISVCMSGSGKLSSLYKADVFTLCYFDCAYSIDPINCPPSHIG